ncbi:hypothetical protein [Sphaerisporangium krabiense]|uniref:Uncharacterized protein n=1 Tax=Sphaerisporangium krabiense TaxID=763782 RepID=A0A7W8ZAM4_9ACTN|nr:hypothetical protein [Sphaerisporangium krabiense]MBB5630482.1 hypothetical protein [Sphaerisporangium krabiense]
MALIVMVFMVSGCAGGRSRWGNGAPLLTTGDQESIFVLEKTVIGAPYLFGSDVVCLDRKGEVRVVSVGFEGGAGSGMAVQAFTFRPFYASLGTAGVRPGDPRTLARRGLSVNHTVAQTCAPEGDVREEFAEWVVQAVRTGPRTGYSPALRMTYLSGGRTHVLRVPFGIRMCGENDAHAAGCAKDRS